MKILNLIQGSPEWLAHRKTARNASEAPIIMGASKNVKRTEFLDMKVTGSEREFSEWFRRNVLDRGHEVEALARPFAEEIVGEDLYPVTATSDDLYLSASFDGASILNDVIWECKQWNEAKAAEVREGRIPECDVWQVIQQLVVSGADKCLYMVTDGTKEKTVHLWRDLKDSERKTLLAAWKQFDEDADRHEPRAAAAEVIAAPQDALPALSVQVSGSLTIIDNLDVFGAALESFVDQMNLSPRSDQDFADLDAAGKALKKAEDALSSEEDRALAQADGIEALRRAVGRYKDLARTTRLRAEKVVKAEKENRRNEIRAAAVDEFRAHIERINAALGGRIRMPDIAIDVAGAMRGRKTISSLEDAAATEVARAKIEASQIADKIRINQKALNDLAGDHQFLFADAQDLVLKPSDDLLDLIRARIINHETEEQRKLEAERERIRREEEARAQREAEAKAEQERERIRSEEQEKARAEAKANSDKPAATALHGAHGSVAYAADGEPATTQAPAEKPRIRQQSAPAKTRPTDQEIIATLAMTYRVHESKVIEWLLDMDLDGASDHLAANL